MCINIGESPYIVIPCMTHGSLLSYLRKYRAELTIFNEDSDDLARRKTMIMLFRGHSYAVCKLESSGLNIQGSSVLSSENV